VVAPPWVVVATHIRCLSSKATPSNLSLTIIASNLAPQPSETSTQLCVVTQRGGERHAGDSLTLTEAHHIRCRERSCQLGYERRGVVCHVMQDLCRCRLLVRPRVINFSPTARELVVDLRLMHGLIGTIRVTSRPLLLAPVRARARPSSALASKTPDTTAVVGSSSITLRLATASPCILC
jgi:hypothetical protein